MWCVTKVIISKITIRKGKCVCSSRYETAEPRPVRSRFCCPSAGGPPPHQHNDVTACPAPRARRRLASRCATLDSSVCARPPHIAFVSDAVLVTLWQLLSWSCDVFVSELWCIPMKMWSDFQVRSKSKCRLVLCLMTWYEFLIQFQTCSESQSCL